MPTDSIPCALPTVMPPRLSTVSEHSCLPHSHRAPAFPRLHLWRCWGLASWPWGTNVGPRNDRHSLCFELNHAIPLRRDFSCRPSRPDSQALHATLSQGLCHLCRNTKDPPRLACSKLLPVPHTSGPCLARAAWQAASSSASPRSISAAYNLTALRGRVNRSPAGERRESRLCSKSVTFIKT